MLQQRGWIELGEVVSGQHLSGVLVETRNAIAQASEDLIADGIGGTGPVVGSGLHKLLTTTRAEQFDRVALVNSEFGGGTVQIHDELVHAHAAADAVELRALGGHNAHWPARLLHMLGTFHIESGGGAVDAVGVAQWHDGSGRVVWSQVRAAVGDAMADLHTLDRAELRLQAQLGTVKGVEVGHGISYGRTYLTPDNTSTAIVPLGYADGIHRSASGFDMEGAKHVEKPGGPVRIMTTEGPKLYRVCGRVCMDQFIVDLHGSAAELGVHEGDTVELFGPGRGEQFVEPTADDWARAADTISYEVFTCLRNRIPRLYEHAAEVLPADDLAKLDPATLL